MKPPSGQDTPTSDSSPLQTRPIERGSKKPLNLVRAAREKAAFAERSTVAKVAKATSSPRMAKSAPPPHLEQPSKQEERTAPKKAHSTGAHSPTRVAAQKATAKKKEKPKDTVDPLAKSTLNKKFFEKTLATPPTFVGNRVDFSCVTSLGEPPEFLIPSKVSTWLDENLSASGYASVADDFYRDFLFYLATQFNEKEYDYLKERGDPTKPGIFRPKELGDLNSGEKTHFARSKAQVSYTESLFTLFRHMLNGLHNTATEHAPNHFLFFPGFGDYHAACADIVQSEKGKTKKDQDYRPNFLMSICDDVTSCTGFLDAQAMSQPSVTHIFVINPGNPIGTTVDIVKLLNAVAERNKRRDEINQSRALFTPDAQPLPPLTLIVDETFRSMSHDIDSPSPAKSVIQAYHELPSELQPYAKYCQLNSVNKSNNRPGAAYSTMYTSGCHELHTAVNRGSLSLHSSTFTPSREKIAFARLSFANQPSSAYLQSNAEILSTRKKSLFAAIRQINETFELYGLTFTPFTEGWTYGPTVMANITFPEGGIHLLSGGKICHVKDSLALAEFFHHELAIDISPAETFYLKKPGFRFILTGDTFEEWLEQMITRVKEYVPHLIFGSAKAPPPPLSDAANDLIDALNESIYEVVCSYCPDHPKYKAACLTSSKGESPLEMSNISVAFNFDQYKGIPDFPFKQILRNIAKALSFEWAEGEGKFSIPLTDLSARLKAVPCFFALKTHLLSSLDSCKYIPPVAASAPLTTVMHKRTFSGSKLPGPPLATLSAVESPF